MRGRVVEVRGPDQGSNDHIDKLARKYTGRERYTRRSDDEVRIVLRIKPTHVLERGVNRPAAAGI